MSLIDDDSDDEISLAALNDAKTCRRQEYQNKNKGILQTTNDTTDNEEDEAILAAFHDDDDDDDDDDEMMPPAPSQTSMSRLKSSFQWTKAMVKCKNQHEGILKKYEHQSSTMSMRGLYQHKGMSDADPINILCMDGGGMKGYCTLAVIEELQKMMNHDDLTISSSNRSSRKHNNTDKEDNDLMQYFDLSCGTSVGGIAALMQGYHGTKKRAQAEARLLLDRIREKSFKRFSGWSLFSKGTLTTGQDKIAHILEDYYGETPLYNPGGLRAFALCAARHENGPGKEATFEPFVLRSYDLKDDEDEEGVKKKKDKKTPPLGKSSDTGDAKNSSNKDDKDKVDFKVDGTNEVLLWEAMAATSAAPVLTERVQLTLNGEKKRFADGCIVSNAPVVIAMAEARRLWPNRPLGVILMLGLGKNEDDLIERAMEAAKMDSPNLEYLRLVPPVNAFKPTETEPERIQEMQKVGVEHVRKNAVQVKAILSKLKLSGSRRSPQNATTMRTTPSKTSSSKKKNRMSVWTSRKSMACGAANSTNGESLVHGMARRMTMRHSVKLDLKDFDDIDELDESTGDRVRKVLHYTLWFAVLLSSMFLLLFFEDSVVTGCAAALHYLQTQLLPFFNGAPSLL